MKFNKQGLYNLIERTTKSILLTATPNQYGWFGDYKTWELAQQATSGYDSSIILEKVRNALLKVKSGEAVYERDSVLFDEVQYSWGTLSGLLQASIHCQGRLSVLDFGGSLGSGYFQNKKALDYLTSLKWSVIEQPHFVQCGKENFQNEQLSFYTDYAEFISFNPTPDVLLLSSVIQYLDKPFSILDNLLAKNIPTVILDITTFIDGDRDRITIQKVPPHIYDASYPCWFFNKEKLCQYFHSKGFSKLGEWKHAHDLNTGYHAGMIFNKI